MTKQEVAKLLAFVTATYPNVDISDATVEAWYELLGDLPWEVVVAATKKVLAEQEIPCLPAVGKIRQAATNIALPGLLSPAEAWATVSRAIRKYGYYRQKEGLASLPPQVRQAAECIGWRELCLAEDVEVVRAQFMRVYEQYATRKREEVMIPAPVREMIYQLAERFALPEGGGDDGKVRVLKLPLRRDDEA